MRFPCTFWGVMRKAPKRGALHPVDEDINRIIAMVRARVEHPFRVIKRQFAYCGGGPRTPIPAIRGGRYTEIPNVTG